MTNAITFAPSAAPLLPMVSAWPDCSLSYRLESAALSGPVTPTAPTPKSDGGAQLLVQVEILAAEAKRHRNNRQSKAASISERRLRDLRNNIFLAGMAAKGRG